jgi:hypothetical protein
VAFRLSESSPAAGYVSEEDAMAKQARDWIRRRWTALGVATAFVYSAMLFGCGGGDSGPSPVPSPTPRPPVRNVIVQQTFQNLPPIDPPVDASDPGFFQGFVTGQTGDLDITVDWTFATNDLDFVLVTGTLEQALSPACQEDSPACPLELVATAATFAKPEVMMVPNAAAGPYVIVVVNFGTTNESGVITVGLTTAAATTSTTAVGAVRSTTASRALGSLSDDLNR